MYTMKYFFELYEQLPRGGPGDNKSTKKAYQYLTNLPDHPKILDIGCGPGMQTLQLARLSKGIITAIDNHQPFLDILDKNAKNENLNQYITSKNQSMLEMDFPASSFDCIWSEGSLYFFGFDKGLSVIHNLLKEQGYIVFTEAVYFKEDIPNEVKAFWKDEYDDISTISDNISLLEKKNFDIIHHFSLPKSSWFTHFYTPMKKIIKKMYDNYKDNSEALDTLKQCQYEIDFYDKNADYFGYEFFIGQKK